LVCFSFYVCNGCKCRWVSGAYFKEMLDPLILSIVSNDEVR
jgi:hypothetical protein